jgi:hypothetical protein
MATSKVLCRPEEDQGNTQGAHEKLGLRGRRGKEAKTRLQQLTVSQRRFELRWRMAFTTASAILPRVS